MKNFSISFLRTSMVIVFGLAELLKGSFGKKTSKFSVKLESSVYVDFKQSAYFQLIPNPISIPSNTTAWVHATVEAIEAVAHTLLQPNNCGYNQMKSQHEFINDTVTDVMPIDTNSNFTDTTCAIDISGSYTIISIVRSASLLTVIDVVGWIYFAVWSVSFYPQIVLNSTRKCVVGLSFDFVALNMVGFICYAIFNCVLFWSADVQAQYRVGHPSGVIPVLINDVVFSIHAVVASLVTITQCIVYNSGTQRVSNPCKVLMTGFFIFAVGNLLLAQFTTTMNVLQFITNISYIKLAVNFTKYLPQAYYNYQRKSTVGWSILNRLLDFTGGVMSVMQLVIQAFNSDDWSALLGDFTKLGIGLLSLLFDLLFIFQHYILYPDRTDNSYEKLDNTKSETKPSNPIWKYGSTNDADKSLPILQYFPDEANTA